MVCVGDSNASLVPTSTVPSFANGVSKDLVQLLK